MPAPSFWLQVAYYQSIIYNGGGNFIIGDNVRIKDKAWLAAIPETGEKSVKLEIMDGCEIGHYNEIYATKEIVIEKNVLTADRVYISDNLHGFNNPEIPIMYQQIVQNNTVRIGEGSWIGVGVSILGAHVGKHCVIGANAVVTSDIPDYSVAVGVPAKVIKRYDTITHQWRKTNGIGEFI